MNKTRAGIATLGVVSLAALTACGDDELTMGTGGEGGVYYPLGGEIASIIQDNTDASVTYVSSGGSGENLGQIYQGEWQLGLTQNDTFSAAYHGELDELDDVEVDNVGWIANLYPEAMHIIVRADSGIESIEDLEGETIAVGDAGSGTRMISDAILSAHGIEDGDYTPEVSEFGDSTDMLADGQIDATMFVVGVPVAQLNQLAQNTDVNLLSIDDAMVEEIAAGGEYEAYTIESGAYDFLDEDVNAISVFAALVASLDDVDDDLAYEITEALFDNAGSITVDVGESIDIDEALFGIGDVPLHPGAERYYEEQGIDIP